MPVDLGDGLYLALVGMGLVFLSLVAFMLILLALQKLFPGEEVAEVEFRVEVTRTDEELAVAEISDYDPVAAAIREAEAGDEPDFGELARVGLRQPVAAIGGRIPGAKIAAIAVALYMAMEQEEDVALTTASITAGATSQDSSGWSTLGRASLWGSQGRRPKAYGQRSQGAYPPRNSLRD